jgi:uncharacterized phage-associated protein
MNNIVSIVSLLIVVSVYIGHGQNMPTYEVGPIEDWLHFETLTHHEKELARIQNRYRQMIANQLGTDSLNEPDCWIDIVNNRARYYVDTYRNGKILNKHYRTFHVRDKTRQINQA